MNLFDKNFEMDFDDLKKVNFIINNKSSFNDGFDLHFNYYEKVGLTVYKDDSKYEFIIFLIEDCDNILILGPGFLTDEKQKKLFDKPIFDRHTWVDDFEQNLIFYNDPTRYDFKELKGGWGIGNERVWHLSNIAEIIKILSNKITPYKSLDIIPHTNLFFYGSSMGGYMSIVLSILIRNSTSIADIPQFNLFNWIYWNKLRENCFNGFPDDYIFEN